MKALNQYITERLFIRKDIKNEKHQLNWDSFLGALLKQKRGTLNLNPQKINKRIIVKAPKNIKPDNILTKVDGSEITKLQASHDYDDKYIINVFINNDYCSKIGIRQIDDLRNLFGEDQLEEIYDMISEN